MNPKTNTALKIISILLILFQAFGFLYGSVMGITDEAPTQEQIVSYLVIFWLLPAIIAIINIARTKNNLVIILSCITIMASLILILLTYADMTGINRTYEPQLNNSIERNSTINKLDINNSTKALVTPTEVNQKTGSGVN